MVVAMGDDVTPELVDRIGASLREELPDVRVVLTPVRSSSSCTGQRDRKSPRAGVAIRPDIVFELVTFIYVTDTR